MRIRASFYAAACLLILSAGTEAQPRSSPRVEAGTQSQPDPRVQAEALFVQAQKALARGDSETAELFLKEALTQEPAFTSAIWQLAQIYETREKLDYARELLLRGLRQDPQAAWAREKLAQIEGALARTLLAEARACMNARDYRVAIQKISAYLGLKPNDQAALVCMGKCHLAQGNLKAAREYIEKVRASDPDNEEIASLETEIEKRTQNAVLERLVNEAQAALADSASGGAEKARLALQRVIREDIGNSWAKEQLNGLNLRLDREAARKETSGRTSTKVVIEESRKALDESKGALAATGTFILKHVTLFVLAAVLCALIFDIRRKMMRRSYPLEGSLGIIPILDIVALINGNLRTGRLIIVNPDAKGEIYFEQGEIIHARCERLYGKTAFRALMDLRSGRFFFHNHLPNVRHTITEPLSLLLLSMKPREETEASFDGDARREEIFTS